MAWLTRTKTTAGAESPEDAKAIDELIAEATAEAEAEDLRHETRSQSLDRRRQMPWTRAIAAIRRKQQEREQKAPRDAAQWTAGGELATKLSTAALVAALATGPAALAWIAFGGDSDQPPQQAAAGFDQRMMNRQNAAKDAALQFVPAWLAATADNSDALAGWWPDASGLDLPDKGSSAMNVSVVRASADGPGLWTVVVGADVVAADQETPVRRYYQVPVVVSGETNVAAEPVALPAPIPRPSRSVKDVSVSYPHEVTTGSEATTAADGFLSALLTGEGDIRLYERPGVWIPPIKPAPAAEVELTSVQASDSTAETAIQGGKPSDGQTANLLVTVKLSNPVPDSPKQRSSTAQYVLRQVARDGRWEVTAVTAPPALTEARASTDPAKPTSARTSR